MKKKATAIRVEIEYDDGRVLTLDAEGAAAWQEQVDSCATIAFVHGSSFPPLPWKATPTGRPADGE